MMYEAFERYVCGMCGALVFDDRDGYIFNQSDRKLHTCYPFTIEEADPEVKDACNRAGWLANYAYGAHGERPLEDYDAHYSYPTDRSGVRNGTRINECTMEDVLGKPKEKTMYSNIKVIARNVRGISVSALIVGEYARIISGSTGNIGDIVLKTRNGVVNISNPQAEWPSFPAPEPEVERFNIGDKLEITVGFTADFDARILRIARDNKISGIKAMREETMWGLKESKDYVDGLLAR